jgi:class 3 adenylate cyclase/tetratricopeptide (TPR) repeat protein
VPEGHAERRLITAMFIDIVGSTELVALGPERMKRVLDRCFADLAGEVKAEGGTVEKYIGDAIFVIFGAPISHEDDALRALRAAGRCLAKAATATDGRPAVPIRVGVETGDALVDLGAAQTDRQRMAVGACVNVATRLQALAAAGTALVGPGTHEAVGSGAALEPIGNVELKGLGPTPAWRLVGAAKQHARPRVPFIGRAAELEVLELAFRRAVGGRSVLAVVSGPPGQGKTRVVEELVGRIGDRARVLVARCRPSGELGPLDPLRQLLDAATADDVRTRTAGLIADPAEADRVSDALSHSAGLRTSDAFRGMPIADRQDEITNAWRRYLASLGRERPVVVWVEDLHWADPQLVALIDRLTLSGTSPLLVVVTARPEFAQQAGLRPTGQRFFIDLDPLAADEAQQLATLAGGTGDPITGRAEGNPLFIIELARARTRTDDTLPMTLRGAIGARLDDLAERERQILQACAVVGEAFTTKEASLLLARDAGEVHVSLDRLFDLHYLRSTDDGIFRFHHGLLREVAYGQLPIAERLRLHARFAREGLAADDADRRAYHLWEAVGGPDAAWVWEDAAARAALRRECRAALLAAARTNSEAFLFEAAIAHGERALALADTPLDRAEAHLVLGEVYALAVAGDEALAHLMPTLAAYREAGVTPPARIYAAVADSLSRPGGLRVAPDPEEIRQILEEGLVVARTEADLLSEARILAGLAERTDRPDEAERLFTEIGSIVDRADDETAFVEILSHQASHELNVGRLRRAKELLDRAAALAATTRSARRDVLFYQTANVTFALGDLAALDASNADYERAVRSAGPHVQQHPRRGRGLSALIRGDWQQTRAIAREVAQAMDEHPETVFCIAAGGALSYGVCAAAISGELVEARELLARAKTLTALPNVGEGWLALGYSTLGLRGDVLRIDDQTKAYARTIWLPIALPQLGEWDRVTRCLPELDRIAANAGRYAGAVAAAIREELAAREGGPPPRHEALREIGYLGISELLSFRSKVD